MDGEDWTTFLNRKQELQFVAGLLPPEHLSSSLVIIRSPSGFGKSSLVDQVLGTTTRGAATLAIVDPQIRRKQGAAAVFDGFYIQRCAEDLSARSGPDVPYPALRTFILNRKWASVREKRLSDLARQFPGLRSLHKLAVDYFDRVAATGSYAADAILQSDSASSVRLCREYVDAVMRRGRAICVLRETQLIDGESLRYFLEQNLSQPENHLLIEYTAETPEFTPEHEKIVLRIIETHPSAHILDLVRLDRIHLEELVKRYTKGKIELTSDYYATWSGNLRSVMEIKYRAAVGRRIESERDLRLQITGLPIQIRNRFGELAPLEQMILAVTAAHMEAIHRETLRTILGDLPDPPLRSELDAALNRLREIHHFIELHVDRLRLQNEDVSSALDELPRFKGLVAIAQKALRDHYLAEIEIGNFAADPLSLAVRQAFRLCLATGDIQGLSRSATKLTEKVRAANDQGAYVDIVHSALTEGSDFLTGEKEFLVDWAASLAYEIGSFEQAADLLDMQPRKDTFHQAMLACCAQEIGKHELALELVRSGPASWPGRDAQLAAALIDVVTSRALHQIDYAAARLTTILDDREFQKSALYGYALRFTETVMDFPDCTPRLLESAQRLGEAGLPKSKAYSLLAAAIHLAREGRLKEAATSLDDAKCLLSGEVRNEYIFLNNDAVVGLLTPQSDYERCCTVLGAALRMVREDYSELTIVNNLAIALWEAGRHEDALRNARRAVAALAAPSFGDRDIYWAVCFNAARMHRMSGEEAKAAEILSIPSGVGRPPDSYADYWHFRFGDTTDLDAKYMHMTRFPYHPLFLSNWLIELEGLAVLKKQRPE